MFAPFILYIVYFGFRNMGSDIREILGTNGFLRPIMNLALSTYPTIVLIYLLLYMQYHNKLHLFLAIVLIIGSSVLASRSVMFTSLVTAFMFYSINKGRKISLVKVAMVGSVTVVGVFAASAFRTGTISDFGGSTLFSQILYGNTFSDIRDFAWVLGYWDGNLLLGKTYAAGILSFVPSALSDFRQEWGMGHFTLTTTGMFSSERFHGGLRCTIFGEPYFNFGIIGVIIISFIYGYIFESVNQKVIRSCRRGLYMRAYASSTILNILGCIMISSGSFNIYLFFLPIIFLYFLGKTIDYSMGIRGKIRLYHQ